MQRIRLPVTVPILALFAALAATPASALSFVADLTSIRVDAEPGEISNRVFQLKLVPGEGPARFQVRMEDFWQSEDGRESFYRAAGTVPRSCAPWVSINPTEAALPVGGILEVRMSVTVPREVDAGGYWCALTLDQVPDPMAAAGGVRVQFLASVSVGVFVYVPPVVRDARILEVRLDDEMARVRIGNQGNAPFAVEGRLEFFRPGAPDPVATVRLPRTTVLLDPVPSRWIEVGLPAPSELPPGRYLVRAVVDVGLDHYLGVQKEMDLHRASAHDPRP